MSKTVSKRILAFIACVMTVMQSIVPAYALEQTDALEPVNEATNQVIIETSGSGNMTVQENGNVHDIRSNPLTLQVPNGTTMNLTVTADEGNEISDITNHDVRIPQFIEPTKQVQFEFAVTEDAHIKAIFRGIQITESTENTIEGEPIQSEIKKDESEKEIQENSSKESHAEEDTIYNSLLINEETFNPHHVLTAHEQQVLNEYKLGQSYK
ncbi:MAG: hypothetical protein Q4A76_05240, partial [Porphyromonadaceae bacterium]|nr:hypothetical protein [Porphyromonadaceae bacterium]